MNRTGILVDLSHVGNRTTKDAILWSEKPVAVTHANPDSLFAHKRNKTDDVLKVLAERGGVLGCATYRNITGDHYCSSLRNWCEMVAKSVDIAGIDHVAIGTDRSHNFTKPDYDWMRMGRWTRGIDYGAASAARPGNAPPPAWFTEVHHLGLLPCFPAGTTGGCGAPGNRPRRRSTAWGSTKRRCVRGPGTPTTASTAWRRRDRTGWRRFIPCPSRSRR